MKNENMAFGYGLEIEIVDFDDSRIVASEDGAANLDLFIFGLDFDCNRAGEITGAAALRLDDFDSPFPCHHRGINVIYA